MSTSIQDLYLPPVWTAKMPEYVRQRNTLLNSGICVTAADITAFASGPGSSVVTPILIEPNHADEVQKENVAPAINRIRSGRHRAAILNRVHAIGATAFSQALSGADPVGFILGTTARVRLRHRQATLVSNLRGAFGSASAKDGAAALKAHRLDLFAEAAGDITADHLFESDKFADLLSLFGEEKDIFLGGSIVVHSKIEAAMLKQDDIAYVRDSEGKIILRTYKGIPLYIDDSLVFTAAGGAKVYDIYVFLPGSIVTGEKPQTSNVGDIASLILDGDAAKNNLALYDRTRFIQHIQGIRWKPDDAADGTTATNAEIATPGNWELAMEDSRYVGVVCLRVNG